jgi:membrane-associated phospholipid phosphatase
MKAGREQSSQTPAGAERTHWVRALTVAFSVILLSAVVAYPSSWLIQSRYPDRPKPEDLLFQLLPYSAAWQFVVEAIYIAGAVLLGVYVFRHAIRRIPEIIAVYGIMEIGRALTMALTPLAAPYDSAAHFGIQGVRNWGEFPSGHAATFLLYYLIVDERVSPGIKKALLVMLFAEILALLISHSHYSIDIVGGLLLGYFVYHAYFDGHLFDWLAPWLKV